MANRFPLIVDTTDGNRLKEIPSGDSLDFSSVGIANLTSLSVSGALSSSTMATTGNVSLGGTLNVTGASTISTLTATTMTATSLTLNGNAVVPQIQSDWTETDTGSAAFILNKPVLNQIDNLDDIGDVNVADAVLNEVLTYDGFTWQSSPAAGGVGLADFSVVTNPASGQGSLIYDAAGTFTFTPANALTAGSDISLLNNDSEFTTLAVIDAANYLQQGDVIGSGRITATPAAGQVTLTFDATGLLSAEVDTLETVTGRGATSSVAIEADAFNQAPTSTNTNTLKDVSIETLDILTGITGTNSTIALTNGNITTGGNIQAQDITATQNLSAGFIVGAVNISNTTGDMELTVPTGSRIDITAGRLRLGSTTGVPANPEIGEIIFDGSTFFAYVNDTDGAGTAGAVGFPSVNNPFGLQLPQVETGDEPLPAVEGMMIYNLTDDEVQVYKPTGWTSIG